MKATYLQSAASRLVRLGCHFLNTQQVQPPNRPGPLPTFSTQRTFMYIYM